MNMIRYEPWGMVNEFSKTLSDLLQSRDNAYIETSQWLPAVDIYEEKDKFIICVDLPGVDKDKIQISMENNFLSIKGERHLEQIEKDAHGSRIERVKGRFERRFSLPDTADEERIVAKMDNGVLTITAPKKEKTQSRNILIEVSK